MTTTCFGHRAARLVGGLLLLLCSTGGAASSTRADTLARHHVCEGQCASCQKTPGQKTPGQKGSSQNGPHSPDVACHSAENACARAGDPHRIAWYAQPSRSKRDSFGYVGGGTAWRGEPRMADEGTWGVDYAGVFSHNHIWLKWLHGRPSRQTGGSYNTDGPHLLSH